MAMRPNYRQDRAARDRAKEVKKDEKTRRRDEETAKRKALRADETDNEGGTAPA